VKQEKIGSRTNGWHDLPKELKAELQFFKTDDLQQSMLDEIIALGGHANTDEILVGIYRRTGKIHNRAFVSNKLYRMAKSGLLSPIPKVKGGYKLFNKGDV
jgi:hypothetical protein